MHRLWRETHVRAHRHRPLNQKAHRIGEPFAAFQLDHLGARAHQLHGAGEGGLGRAIGAERQIGDDQRRGACPCYAGGVIGDLREGDRQRRRLTLQHVTERVADQQHVDAGAVQQRSEARVVTGEHGDLLACIAHCLQFRDGNGVPARFLQIAHGVFRWKKRRAPSLRATCL